MTKLLRRADFGEVGERRALFERPCAPVLLVDAVSLTLIHLDIPIYIVAFVSLHIIS